MSALLNATPKNASGVITLNGQIAATLDYANGLPYEGGALAVDTIGAISHYHMGLPYTAVDRLAVAVKKKQTEESHRMLVDSISDMF